MTCNDCGVPMVPRREWKRLDPATRRQYLRTRTLAAHASKGLCERHYVRAQRALGPRSVAPRRTNAQMHDLFREHDPGPDFTNTERFETASKATGIAASTFCSASYAGDWDMGETEPLNWPSFIYRGITYWRRPNETPAELLQRIRNSQRAVA